MSTVLASTPSPAPAAPVPAAPATKSAPAPQDPFLHDLLIKSTPEQRTAFEQALAAQLRQTATSGVSGWSSPHVEKPSFPFQVAKQRGIWAPQAVAQLASNKAGVVQMLTNPSIDNMLLMGVEQTMNPGAPPISHDVSDPDFLQFYQAVCKAGATGSNYTFYGTLVNVGWGNGDHVNVTSESLPAGPQTVANHLAHSADGILFTPAVPGWVAPRVEPPSPRSIRRYREIIVVGGGMRASKHERLEEIFRHLSEARPGGLRQSKRQRLEEIFRRLSALPPSGSHREAKQQMDAVMDQVEDELSGIPADQSDANNDGRLYAPLDDNRRGVDDYPAIGRYQSREHNTFIRDNGAIEVRLYRNLRGEAAVPPQSGDLVWAKAGRDGQGVWEA